MIMFLFQLSPTMKAFLLTPVIALFLVATLGFVQGQYSENAADYSKDCESFGIKLREAIASKKACNRDGWDTSDFMAWNVWNNDCCTTFGPCGEGEGDCDGDEECAGDLKCGTDNCPWNGYGGSKDDCCAP